MSIWAINVAGPRLLQEEDWDHTRSPAAPQSFEEEPVRCLDAVMDMSDEDEVEDDVLRPLWRCQGQCVAAAYASGGQINADSSSWRQRFTVEPSREAEGLICPNIYRGHTRRPSWHHASWLFICKARVFFSKSPSIWKLIYLWANFLAWSYNVRQSITLAQSRWASMVSYRREQCPWNLMMQVTF